MPPLWKKNRKTRSSRPALATRDLVSDTHMLTKNKDKVIIVIKTKKGLTYLRAKCQDAITTLFVKEEEERRVAEKTRKRVEQIQTIPSGSRAQFCALLFCVAHACMCACACPLSSCARPPYYFPARSETRLLTEHDHISLADWLASKLWDVLLPLHPQCWVYELFTGMVAIC